MSIIRKPSIMTFNKLTKGAINTLEMRTIAILLVGTYRLKSIPECEADYPEFHMFGELPTWGLYVRHVDGLTLRNVNLTLKEPDYRQKIILDDVENFSTDER